jgi:hypothetical protein
VQWRAGLICITDALPFARAIVLVLFNFIDFRVVHINRARSSVADALARLGRSGCDQFFGDVIPDQVRE